MQGSQCCSWRNYQIPGKEEDAGGTWRKIYVVKEVDEQEKVSKGIKGDKMGVKRKKMKKTIRAKGRHWRLKDESWYIIPCLLPTLHVPYISMFQ